MLSENIKTARKAKGLSQQELATQVHVVRQTVSKWEQGLSVPDSEMLVSLSDALKTPVGALLGEGVVEQEPDDLKAISAKLEVINSQLAQKSANRRRVLHRCCIAVGVVVVVCFAVLAGEGSPYQDWNYGDPETAVLGVAYHCFEWVFVRAAPIVLIAAIAGAVLTRKRA